ncbi:MAG: undecaprenyl-diphosphate phosphatase [Chitinophagales bacterium]|nr:undecaprenyl-diphosphate phosphatase [Chitinophagales bacterium]
MTTAEAVILAIVEGLTEFLPVSSTGHLILTEAFMGMERSRFTNVFIINVQFGAIFSVVVLYWRRFFQSLDFYFKLLAAFIPAGILGLLLNDYIDSLLSSVTVVAVSLVIGGIVLIAADIIYKKQIEASANEEDEEVIRTTDEFGVDYKTRVLKKFEIGWLQAFIIGCWQCAAMVPGVSRSAASIIGGLTQKMTMKRAAEFSFFLAVPTIFAASAYKLYKSVDFIRSTDINLLLIGNVVSFIVGIIAIKFFIGLITRYGMKFFGIYRIVLGLFILALLAKGYDLKI